MKEHLASMEEFHNNVTRRGEKKFINSLRAMAANSDTQGSKAWDDLFEDGCTSFGFLWVQAFWSHFLLEVFFKEMQAPDINQY